GTASLVDNVTVDHPGNAGLVYYSSGGTARNVRVDYAAGSALVFSNAQCLGIGSSPSLAGVTITQPTNDGLLFQNGQCSGTTYAPTVTDLTVTRPGRYGVYVSTTSATVAPVLTRVVVDHPLNHGVYLNDCGLGTLASATIE